MSLVLLLLIGSAFCATDTGSPYPSYNSPNHPCSAYCRYQPDGNGNLASMCSAPGIASNIDCTDCDELLFRKVGSQCIDHRYNGEFQITPATTLGYRLGYYTNSSAVWINGKSWTSTTLGPHFAVRIRFGIQFYSYTVARYYYPLSYSMDETEYTYNPALKNYWSDYDIITSTKQNHTSNRLVVTFRNMNDSLPKNTGNCGDENCWCRCSVGFYNSGIAGLGCNDLDYKCGGTLTRCDLFQCVSGTDPCTCTSYWSCCDFRYIQIRDIILFISPCQTGCLICVSQTYCTLCDNSTHYLNQQDHLCYQTCPQATYKNLTTLFKSNAGYNTSLCMTCNATCLQCDNLTYCTRCYTLGRNQSFLFNNTCVNPCPNGYVANYTNHTCHCPLDYFYQNPAILVLLCISCAKECIRCFGPTNLECTVCQKDFYLANGTTYCLNECPAGQYKHPFLATCHNCSVSCASCQFAPDYCTECLYPTGPQTKYLLGHECLTWCPDGYSWNNLTRRCDVCDIYTFSYLGACVRYCPTLFYEDNENHSCIHFSRTDYRLNISLERVNVLNHGKLLKFTILAGAGLNPASLDAVIKKSYYQIQILYRDSMLQNFEGVRNLLDISLPIRNIEISGSYIYFYTTIPEGLDYHKSFQVVFQNGLASTDNISYANATNVLSLNQHPEIMREYFSYTVRSLYNIIVLPLLLVVLFLFALQFKGCYELLIQFLRILQILGVLLFSVFPVGPLAFRFLQGCSYSNLDFIPNLYAMWANPEKQTMFTSYFLVSQDMDFIRLNGSMIFFGVLWIIIVFICKYLFNVSKERSDYLVKFGLDLAEVKLLHSFWSSFIFVIVNFNSSNFPLYVTFGFAMVGGMIVVARRWLIWRETGQFSPFFAWRVAITFLICFMAMGNELVIGIMFLIGVFVASWHWLELRSPRYLVNIAQLTSSNYMEERTFRVLNNYDNEVRFALAIPTRNALISLFPIFNAALAAVIILLKDEQNPAVIFDAVILHVLLVLVIIVIVLVYYFLKERRRFLVQNKLSYLQRKYAKLNTDEYGSERQRPRISNTNHTDDEKTLDNPAGNRQMMKNFD